MTWALATIAALLIGYATVSRRLERLNVSGAMFFTTAGLLVGPVLGLLDLQVRGEQVKLLAEITLTLVLFADASRISLRALRHESGVPLRLLGIGLPLTIAAGALVGVAVVPGISFAEALVLAIVLACTDAALGQAVVSDRRVPSRIRQGLNVESGLNDGLCVPLFFIAIAIAATDAGEASADSAAQLVFEQIGYGLVGGVAAGALGGLALRFAARRRLVEPHWLQILTLASALLAAGVASALGGSIFIAAFTGGFLFGGLRRDSGGEVTYLVDEGGELFNAVTFIVFGAVILGPQLDEVTLRLVLYAVLSLTLVRMLPVALALLGTGARPPTVAFLGWFGPRGLASIVFAVILLDDTTLPHLQTLLLAITVTIALSVYAHGLTAMPLTERYARWWSSHPRDALPAMESQPATEHRARLRIGAAEAGSRRDTENMLPMSTTAGHELRPITSLWWLLLLFGVVALGVGIFFVVSPHETLSTFTAIAGIFVLVDGVIAVIASIFGSGEGRGLLALIGVLSAIAGLILIKKPFETLVVFTLIVGVWFVVAGIVRVVSAFARGEGRGGNILIALLDLVAGAVILAWPDLGLATLAVIIGIVLVVRGVLFIATGWQLRTLDRALESDPPE